MNETFDLKMPNGEVITGIPVGTSKVDIAKKLGIDVLSEVRRVADTSIRGGLLALPQLMSTLDKGTDWAGRKLAQKVTGAKEMPPEAPEMLPMPWDVATKLIGTPERPQTTIGKYAGSIGEGAVSAMFPGKLAELGGRALIGGMAGLGAEAAGQASSDLSLMRLLGGLAGGGITAGLAALRPNWRSMVRQSTSDVTPKNFADARKLEDTLISENLPNLKSQLLGPSSSLDDLVQQASQNPQVRPKLLKVIEGISDKAMSSLKNWRAGNLPVMPNETRGALLDIQQAAADADKAAVGLSNKAFREAMPDGERYSGNYIRSLVDDIKTLAKSERYGVTSRGGETLLQFAKEKLMPLVETGVPQAHLNNLVKDLNTLAFTENWKGLPTNDLKALLKSYTPEFDSARAAKTAIMKSDVAPMRQGLAGQIAQMGGGPSDNKYTMSQNVLNLVFPADKAQGIAIERLGVDVGGEPVGTLLGEYLIRNMEKAAKGFPEGSIQAPSKFADMVLGTPAQRTNVEAALSVVAKTQNINPSAVRRGFYDLLHAFASYKDLKIAPGLGAASANFEAGKSVSGAVVAPQSALRRGFWERASTRTYQKIADLVTSPEGLKLIEQIARTKDPNRKGILLQSLIATTTAEPEDKTPDVIK